MVLPSEVSAIEAHEGVCAGYRESQGDASSLPDNVTIADAFVCPQCFTVFQDQVSVWRRSRVNQLALF